MSTLAGEYRGSWLIALRRPRPRRARRQIRRLERDIDTLFDEHGTMLRDEPGIGAIAAATLLAEVGDPFRFARESKFARWSGTGAVALSSGEGDGRPVKHRLDFRGNRRINSVLDIASVTQHRDLDDARIAIDRKLGEGKTRREARRTKNVTSPTVSSDACGKTNRDAETNPSPSPLDKGASDTPAPGFDRRSHGVRDGVRTELRTRPLQRWMRVLSGQQGSRYCLARRQAPDAMRLLTRFAGFGPWAFGAAARLVGRSGEKVFLDATGEWATCRAAIRCDFSASIRQRQ